jgi:hypothetical protein
VGDGPSDSRDAVWNDAVSSVFGLRFAFNMLDVLDGWVDVGCQGWIGWRLTGTLTALTGLVCLPQLFWRAFMQERAGPAKMLHAKGWTGTHSGPLLRAA